MARRLSAEWRAEWRERLVRFRGWPGTSGEFCRQEGISRSSLLRWAQRLRVPVTALSPPGTGLARVRAKPETDRAPFAAVRIRPVPGTDAALRVVLPNGTRLEVPERDPAGRGNSRVIPRGRPWLVLRLQQPHMPIHRIPVQTQQLGNLPI